MYAFELSIGITLTIVGIAVLLYILYNLKVIATKDLIIFTSEAIATITIGIFYITCSILIAVSDSATSDHIDEPVLNLTFTDNSEFVSQEEHIDNIFDANHFYPINPPDNVIENIEPTNTNDSIDEVLVSYTKIFSDLINVRNDSMPKFNFNTRFQESKRSLESAREKCDFKELYFKYIMLISSFLYGLMSLINTTYECRTCVNAEKAEQFSQDKASPIFVQSKFASTSAQIEELDEEKSEKNINLTDPKKIYSLVLVSWLVPILYTITVYFTIENDNNEGSIDPTDFKPLSSDIVSLIQQPLNVTSMEGPQVDEIINKIYKIMTTKSNKSEISDHHASPNIMFDIIKYFNNRKKRSNGFNCDYHSMPLKLHTLFVFIVAYFVGLLYTKNMHTKLRATIGNERKIFYLGKTILSFGTLWLPSIIEIFVRIYMMNYAPSVLTDICLTLGNFSRILANGVNVVFLKNMLQSQNNVNPLP